MIKGTRKILKATLQISRASGGRYDEKPMHITVTDELSGCRVCELYMRLDEFTKALMSSEGKASMEYYTNAPIGMKAENKTEVVPCEFTVYGDENIDAALKPFEVDGWKARRSDLSNHHYSVKGGQKVTFFRHVEVETEETVCMCYQNYVCTLCKSQGKGRHKNMLAEERGGK
jgi:hypothetical protein